MVGSIDKKLTYISQGHGFNSNFQRKNRFWWTIYKYILLNLLWALRLALTPVNLGTQLN